jgi:hypothetical protein
MGINTIFNHFRDKAARCVVNSDRALFSTLLCSTILYTFTVLVSTEEERHALESNIVLPI